MGGTCKECTDGTTRSCGECGNLQTCTGGRWPACGSCCPTAVNDTWSTPLAYEPTEPGPWRWVHGDAFVDTEASPKSLNLSKDDIVERSPNYPGGYVISFDVAMQQDSFLAHTNLMGYLNAAFPGFYRATGKPMWFGGMSYGGAWGSFGTWTGTMSTAAASGFARVTIYVKPTKAMAAMAASTGPAYQSGWVTLVPGQGATGNFGFVGTNDSDLAMSNGPAKIGPIKGCAGLSDAQVDALYTAKKQY